MNVSPEVLNWVRKAEMDLAAARRLAAGDEPLPDQMGFFCQQTAEKYLKAFLIASGQAPPRTHDVDVLVEMCAVVDPAFEQLQQSKSSAAPMRNSCRSSWLWLGVGSEDLS